MLFRVSFSCVACFVLAGCGGGPAKPVTPEVSSSIALSSDDKALWVVNPESDSVALVAPVKRSLVSEIALGPTPAQDPTTMRFDPAIRPRALAITPDDKRVFVAGQVAGKVYVIDAASHAVTGSITVGTEPTAVVVSQDGNSVYEINHQSSTVMKIDANK